MKINVIKSRYGDIIDFDNIKESVGELLETVRVGGLVSVSVKNAEVGKKFFLERVAESILRDECVAVFMLDNIFVNDFRAQVAEVLSGVSFYQHYEDLRGYKKAKVDFAYKLIRESKMVILMVERETSVMGVESGLSKLVELGVNFESVLIDSFNVSESREPTLENQYRNNAFELKSIAVQHQTVVIVTNSDYGPLATANSSMVKLSDLAFEVLP